MINFCGLNKHDIRYNIHFASLKKHFYLFNKGIQKSIGDKAKRMDTKNMRRRKLKHHSSVNCHSIANV